MTKDRRLGKGLAALLGTPLEEDNIVDSQPAPPRPVSSTGGNPLPSPERSSAHHASVSIPAPGATSPAQRNTRMTTSNSDASSPVRRVPLHSSSDSGLLSTRELDVADIDNNPFQPRRKFNVEEIESLAESIREHQQLQPVLVRRVGARYQLISGERRLRATIHAGLKTIRAEIREADDRLVAELAIVENLQRKDLDAIEKALSFRRYIDEHGCTQDDLAKRLKIDRSTIANLMRLLELPEVIQQSIQDDKLTAGHARALLPLGDEQQQLDFANRIREESWNVRETERRVTERLNAEDGVIAGSTPAAKNRRRTTPQLASLEQQLRLALGTKTEIRQSASGRGKITISFANADEFDRLCQLICPQPVPKAA